jgi:hypothetical protein
LNPIICSAQTPYAFLYISTIEKGKKQYSMFINEYNDEKEGLAAEVEEIDFLITTNDLIVVVVIMFIKFFQGNKCCST